MSKSDDETTINVTAFKARCLALVEAVAQGKASRIVLTKHDRPVAALVPYDRPVSELWGALRGTVTIVPGADLTQPTGERWDADG